MEPSMRIRRSYKQGRSPWVACSEQSAMDRQTDRPTTKAATRICWCCYCSSNLDGCICSRLSRLRFCCSSLKLFTHPSFHRKFDLFSEARLQERKNMSLTREPLFLDRRCCNLIWRRTLFVDSDPHAERALPLCYGIIISIQRYKKIGSYFFVPIIF